MVQDVAGTQATREFYDQSGWTVTDDGKTVDNDLFGFREDGPVRIALYHGLQSRIAAFLAGSGGKLNFLECGCGGAPEHGFMDQSRAYTGVDFSTTGLALAREKLARAPVPATVDQADICALPFEDGSFDAVYCAHVIYHIEDEAAQARALGEMLRVTRKGGAVIVIAANPSPLLFPVRFAIRSVARNRALSGLLRKFKAASPVPYNPQSIGWMRKALAGGASVEVFTAGMASTWANRHISEHGIAGRLWWRAIAALELRAPRLAARLGNYVVYMVRK